MKKGPGRG